MLSWVCPVCKTVHNSECDSLSNFDFLCLECKEKFESAKVFWTYKPRK